jgi:tripartite-type tricarboxylate transporter receptor subunit TctC
LIAPAGLDPAIRTKIATDVRKVASQPEFRVANLERFALDSVLDTPAEFEVFLTRDRSAAKAKITASGASLD